MLHAAGSWGPLDWGNQVCELYVNGKLVAWFYEAVGPLPRQQLFFASGRQGIWVQSSDARLSAWHACVIAACKQGLSRADFDTTVSRGG